MTRVGLGAALAAMVGGCAPSPVSEVRGEAALDLSPAVVEIVDLSHAYDDRTLFWPTSPTGFELTTVARGVTEGGYFYSANTFSLPEHGGTHLDAPVHFAEQGWTLGEVPIDRLVAPGVVIDTAMAAAEDRDHRLSEAEVVAWETEHGRSRPGSGSSLFPSTSRMAPAARPHHRALAARVSSHDRLPASAGPLRRSWSRLSQ